MIARITNGTTQPVNVTVSILEMRIYARQDNVYFVLLSGLVAIQTSLPSEFVLQASQASKSNRWLCFFVLVSSARTCVMLALRRQRLRCW